MKTADFLRKFRKVNELTAERDSLQKAMGSAYELGGHYCKLVTIEDEDNDVPIDRRELGIVIFPPRRGSYLSPREARDLGNWLVEMAGHIEAIEGQ